MSRHARVRAGFVLALVGAAVLSSSPVTSATGGSALPDNPSVSIVLGTGPFDIYLNGEAELYDVDETYPSGSSPIKLSAAAGQNLIEFTGPSDARVELSRSFWLRAHQSKSVVAHERPNGVATVTVFPNDQSPTAGLARITVRHVAAAPPVKVFVDRATTLCAQISNKRQCKAELPAATYAVSVVLAADQSTVLFESDLALASGKNTIVYLLGHVGSTVEVVTHVLATR